MSSSTRFRIGVDVGGTNTDAVVVDLSAPPDAPASEKILSSFKTETTRDVTTGIEAAIRNVLKKADLDPSDERILSVNIGTTHFINAVVQSDQSRLAKVAVLRLAAPYTTECPPFIDFPEHLKTIVQSFYACIPGGLQIDGRPIDSIDEDEVIKQAKIIQQTGILNIVVIGVFSPLDVNGEQEYRVRDIIHGFLGKTVNVVCSRDVGQVGFIERENASILNASITSFAQQTIKNYQNAIHALGLKCLFYITQNDGTLTTAHEASLLPIKTFSSGATNSMRGASYLAGIHTGLGKKESVLVVDVGGTTTDVGMLMPSGFPRPAAAFIQIAGVRTNFSMPDVSSIGLGGGSRVAVQEDHVTVGPDSVGHQLSTEGLVFGGNQLTATDIAARLGLADVGDASKVAHISNDTAHAAQAKIRRRLEVAIDSMKTSNADCDLILVGGGSILVPQKLQGVARIILPPFHDVANAVGAAIAGVAGDVDTIDVLEGKSVSETIDKLKSLAIQRAIDAGAEPTSVDIKHINVLPVQYVTNQATRIVIKAVGQLGVHSSAPTAIDHQGPGIAGIDSSTPTLGANDEHVNTEPQAPPFIISDDREQVDYKTYRPSIVGQEWILSETDLLFIMEGCGVLGTGGGGSPYPTYLVCRQILRDGGRIRIIDYDALNDSGILFRGGFMGSPSVGSERIHSGEDLKTAGLELAKYCGINTFQATLCDEIGGSNGMQSLQMSKYYDLPALDGDLMGRAYPLLNQVLPAVYNGPKALVPCSLCDGDGNTVILPTVKNEHYVESIMRVVTTVMGSAAALCSPPLSVADAKRYGVTHTQSQAWRIGRAIAICRQTNTMHALAESILKLQTGKCLYVGKIIEVSREVRAGFTWGQITLARLRPDEVDDTTQSIYSDVDDVRTMTIPFQNENLYAYLENVDGTKEARKSPLRMFRESKLIRLLKIAASVPDLITVLDSQSGSHLGTPEYTYGLRVVVVALAGHPLWRTSEGLRVGGPEAFGLDFPFKPLGEYIEPRSVVEEYGGARYMCA